MADDPQKPQPKLLIVEDEPMTIKSLTNAFGRERITVITAADGKQGMVKALSEHPDLIILDIIMPNMDGMAMLDALHGDAWGKNARVLVFTNVASLDKLSEALARGAFEYLVKADWSLAAIVDKVKRELKLI